MDSPVKSDSRLARRAATVGGVDIPAGAVVMVLPGAANRDPRRFDNPHEFDLRRKNANRHLAFAAGPHVCIGMHLARLEAQLALSRLLERLPGLRLDPERPTEPRGLVFRKPPELHVLWKAAA